MLTSLLPATPHEALLFVGAVLLLNATPGVDFLLTVSRTLQGGVRAGAAAALGIGAGSVLHTLAAAFGLAALLALAPAAWAAMQWLGAGYLLWLGWGLLRQAARKPVASGPQPAQPNATARRPWLDFRAGLLTNVLNPKVALFFLAFLPQFVPASTPNTTLSFLMLGAWFVLQSTVFLLALVVLAAQLPRLGFGAGLQRALQAAGGLLFVAMALRLLHEKSPLR